MRISIITLLFILLGALG